jgi:DNA polymerase (family 10)
MPEPSPKSDAIDNESLAMPRNDASTVARLLTEFAQRTALRGGNPYRSRAYSRAAESLLALTVPLDEIVLQDRLREIPGVGEAIADIIRKLHRTGTHPTLEAMRKDVPESVLSILGIAGLRPDKVLKLYRELGVTSVDELEQAARQDRLKPIKGLGAALQRKILQGIEIGRQAQGRRHLHRAAALLRRLARDLKGLAYAQEVTRRSARWSAAARTPQTLYFTLVGRFRTRGLARSSRGATRPSVGLAPCSP